MAGQRAGLKARLHPLLDPWLSLPDHRRARRTLADLPNGEVHAVAHVPYVPQFASPDRIAAYIHDGYDGTQDPHWRNFGADDPAEYAFWAPRVCALACVKMAVEAYFPSRQPSLWELVQRGLAHGGYTVRDEEGRWVDEGWTVGAQMALAAEYGLQAVGQGYASPLSICRAIRRGALVAASVTPELGERDPQPGRYGGHLVLVTGFVWEGGHPAAYVLHNPSGRTPELQAGARIPAARFEAAFAHRLIAFYPASSPVS
ncbi:C39 family peptidase [Aggregatilinea lenta]|uniref:C39 family peptidase n=1 Tax=Aggregatilinea lenta TaxID=913108 RepID=UPI000E5A2661|nr:C39 family peptidase [Aggregatilinea lenta]